MRVDGSSQLAPKLWNYCNILRDDLSASLAQAGGLSYLLARGQSTLAAQVGAQARGDYVEQLTFLLFLKVADGRISMAWKMAVIGAK